MTNILAIQARLDQAMVTFTNASWTDSFPFQQAGNAVPVASLDNAGNGTLSVQSVAPQSATGGYVVKIVASPSGTTPAQFMVLDPTGQIVAIGNTGTAIFAGGILLSLSAGSTPFAAGDSFTLTVLPAPLDVTGIVFNLMLRTSTGAAQVSLAASTKDGTLINGGQVGQAALRIPTATMRKLPPGSYVYDLIASADGYDALAFAGTVDHRETATVLQD